MEEKIVVIDFEHVTELQAICQVGYVVLVNGKIEEEHREYINPKVGDFSEYYEVKSVHGITPDKVKDSVVFSVFWEQFIRNYGDCKWVFHNALSDVATLKKNLCHAGMCQEINRIPPVFDTMELFNGASLHAICKAYDIPFYETHDALDDAKACAKVYLNYINNAPFNQHVFMEEKDKKLSPIAQFRKKRIDSELLKKDLSDADPSHPFYDKKVVITGTLEAFPVRNELAAMLKKEGADIDTSISKKTDYVIVGKGAGPSKMEKIEKLQSEGCSIRMINEKELIEIIEKHKK